MLLFPNDIAYFNTYIDDADEIVAAKNDSAQKNVGELFENSHS